MNDLIRALQFFRSDRLHLLGVFSLLLLATCLNLLKPWPLALMVDSILGSRPLPAWLSNTGLSASSAHLIGLIAILLCGLHVLHATVSAVQNFMAIRLGLRGLARVRNTIFGQLQRFSMRFYQGTKLGDIIYRATWDTYAFQTLFQQGVITFVAASISVVLMTTIMMRLNRPLAVVAVASVPVLFVTIRFFGRKMTERGTAAQRADSEVSSHLQSSIAALPLIQSYTREEHESARFFAYTVSAQQKRLSQHAWEIIYWLLVAIVFAMGTAGVVWVGALEVSKKHLSIGEMLIFLAYLTQLYEPLNQLSHLGSVLASALAGTRRVFEILDAPEEVIEIPDARPVRAAKRGQNICTAPNAVELHGNLAFEHVSFGYTPDRFVLHDINFTLGPGESLAIIGPSGAGKTSLMNLLPRFFDPNHGAVKVEGVDVRQLRLKDLRSQIAVVLQEPIILPATIAENIAYGSPNARLHEIETAARLAHADVFIQQLPGKYETLIGEGAARLSTGEKQRINLARAFLKDSPFLLLDEPTSALDAESEALIATSLLALMKGRTTLMIAHRLSTIKSVTRVLVLENGKVTEWGSPAELAERGNYFARVLSGDERLDHPSH